MMAIELQAFEALAREIGGVSTGGVSPVVTTKHRRQVRFVFNLDWNRELDCTIGQYLNWFKERRQMTQLIRDAVRLYVDLMNGRTDVLSELFPGIVAKLQAQNTDKVGQALQSLAKTQALMAEALTSQPQSGPRPLNVSQVAGPAADDDDVGLLTITATKADGKVAAQNFLDSAFGLQR